MRSLVSKIKKTLIAVMFFITAYSYPIETNASQSSFDNKSAVILSYQRIGADYSPETSIRKEQFEEHIHELIEGAYNIISLPELISSLKKNEAIDKKTVVITFDGGYRSIIEHALPMLEKNKIPFTIFISPNNLNATKRYILSSDLKRLKKNKLITFGLHPESYTRLSNKKPEEIKRQINNAKSIVREILDKEVDFFAYPFGEYSLTYKNIIANSGFKAALTQHSSVAYADQDFFELPRFTMTEKYADIERFRLITNALPLPVTDISPKDPQLNTKKPVIGFTINEDLSSSISSLSCFASDQGKPKIERIGNNRIELRLEKEFSSQRARVNCTIPGPQSAPGELPNWRWFGLLMTVPEDISMQ
jgi:peptidoglycan/xylan/chitin deacetylase (PgdA/CDA1 family)